MFVCVCVCVCVCVFWWRVGGDGGGGGEVLAVVGRLRALKGWTREHATLLEVAYAASISAFCLFKRLL